MAQSRSRYLKPREKQRIIALYLTEVDGKLPTIKSVADYTGRSVDTVRRLVVNAGVYRREWVPVTTAQRKRIIELYLTKIGSRWMSTPEIGKIVGRDSRTVWAVVAEAGLNRNIAESRQTQISAEQKQAIIHHYRTTRWGCAAIAERVGLTRHTVAQVLKDGVGPLARARVWEHEGLCIIGLYQQGRSIQEVADLTDRTRDVVRNLVLDAGVMRSREDSVRLSARRREARTRLANTDIRPLAARWMDGAEVEELAAACDVPADLMWDALADALSRNDPRGPAAKLECLAICTFACSQQCALSLPVNDTARVPGDSPTSSSKQSQRPGIHYVRTGLKLPAPGRHPRYGA